MFFHWAYRANSRGFLARFFGLIGEAQVGGNGGKLSVTLAMVAMVAVGGNVSEYVHEELFILFCYLPWLGNGDGGGGAIGDERLVRLSLGK